MLMADGNHETAIRRNVEVDLLEHLCRACHGGVHRVC